MADSWEDERTEEEQVVYRPAPTTKTALNPAASSFSFNPSAGTFAPVSFSAKPAGPPHPAPEPAATPSPPPPPVAPAQQPAASSPPEPEASNGASKDDQSGRSSLEQPGHASRATSSVDAAVKDVKKMTVSGGTVGGGGGGGTADEDAAETEAQRAARHADIKKTLEEANKHDAREHLNLVFIGHVDAGKSTTAGQILFLTGGVDDRTIEKYEREAKEKNRESWYMAYIMDTNEEERAKGKTVEVGRAYFETPKKRYTILDAPGHKSFVPNMISGASQADVGVLLISARKGEFETGFERGGQTREHAQLAKTLGVTKLVVVINKMDDPSVIEPDGTWSKARYDEVESKLTPFLRSCGYNPKKDVIFLPISGLLGLNMKERVAAATCPWYAGDSLFEVLDAVDCATRDPFAPFRMPIMDRYKDMGTVVMGKSEAGVVKKGDNLYVMPNKAPVKVVGIWRDEEEVSVARPGENLRLRISGVEEEDISAGFVLCSRFPPLVPVVTQFEAQIAILELLEHKPILTSGYKAVLHLHAIVEECEVIKLVAAIDPKTKAKTKAKYVKSGAICIARISVDKPICLEAFDVVPQLGRFTLRDEGRTIAIGKVTRVPKKGAATPAE